MKKKMTAAQKKFLMVTLPEFIVREQGRGFKMSAWISRGEPGEEHYGDGVRRSIPKCGTVACIGGSVQLLHKLPDGNDREVAKVLGITPREEDGLCYYWRPGQSNTVGCAWPSTFASRFAKAKSTVAKAKIAAELCKLVGKTEGKCLHREK
jgi:hypothetical protein